MDLETYCFASMSYAHLLCYFESGKVENQPSIELEISSTDS